MSHNQAHTVNIAQMLEQHNQKRNQAFSYFQQVSIYLNHVVKAISSYWFWRLFRWSELACQRVRSRCLSQRVSCTLGSNEKNYIWSFVCIVGVLITTECRLSKGRRWRLLRGKVFPIFTCKASSLPPSPPTEQLAWVSRPSDGRTKVSQVQLPPPSLPTVWYAPRITAISAKFSRAIKQWLPRRQAASLDAWAWSR